MEYSLTVFSGEREVITIHATSVDDMLEQLKEAELLVKEVDEDSEYRNWKENQA